MGRGWPLSPLTARGAGVFKWTQVRRDGSVRADRFVAGKTRMVAADRLQQ